MFSIRRDRSHLFNAPTLALIVYDYVITFSEEITYIWQSKSSLVFVLFVLNRYGALLYGGLGVISEYTRSQEVSSHSLCSANALL